MSTLTSTSTDTEVIAAYDDNASWYEDASVAKARAFVTACTFLIRRIPTTWQENNTMAQFDPKVIGTEKEAAIDWLATNDTDRALNQPTYSDFRNFRRDC